MPLLGLGKKSAQSAAESESQQVPDELPDLPQESAQADDSQQQEVPDELPPAGDLAPDELPPLTDAGPTSAPDGAEDDKKLYFSSMLQKLHEEGLKSTKLTVTSVNLLTDMKKHWKEQKKSAEMNAMMRQVAESITPLQRLEQEWVSLSEEIEQKKKMLQEKEAQIQKLAEDARSAAIKAEKMKSGLK